ncbi:ABC transporter ATP-binding protein [Burkholderia multivorans]|uniref:ABC transporter ATP-binding protein n=1 Tax=Burkholderia multivorans TaxID=87883 RepID=UPI0005D8E798|nr:ABC transporter ATP-binding protein [Burkholderia multivorans]AJY19252.1 ABC transporter family protein [Burkholderia multivorans ATCC BAA-247]AVR21322.1 ABC transporter ATP-binding protein [Burkholderia multivorans]MBU9662037.1 ABC transporter ATP-binding protein [Burkholderia multivorans]MCO1434720.1 ABC transporter ATP-binding protein [Burkholderia multivorans]UQN59871.1 ABC transporter ATP-binding protein [Burkholderia multivorans]
MTVEVAISVQNVSKCFDVYDKPHHRLLQFLTRGEHSWARQFWALRDVSFNVSKGETVGIVGRNGAGKSTLLQIITGTLTPTSGSVRVRGRVAALLELGAGFNMEFTGTENVFMNAMLLGMTRAEVEKKYDDIVDFSGIGSFVEQPVKTYSSGMFARLAFSVAVHAEPSVLIVDEALSVGDSAFQEKSVTRMKEIRESGTSILFVTHSLPIVRNFCDRAVLLDKGTVRLVGERLTVCDEYQVMVDEEVKRNKLQLVAKEQKGSEVSSSELVADKSIRIVNVVLEPDRCEMGADIRIIIELEFNANIAKYGVGILIHDGRGNLVSVLNTLRDDIVLTGKHGLVRLVIRNNHFAPGEYFVTASVSDAEAMFAYDRVDHACRLVVVGRFSARGLPTVEGYVRCEHDWEY